MTTDTEPRQIATAKEARMALDDDPLLAMCLLSGTPAPMVRAGGTCYITAEGSMYAVREHVITVLEAIVLRDWCERVGWWALVEAAAP